MTSHDNKSPKREKNQEDASLNTTVETRHNDANTGDDESAEEEVVMVDWEGPNDPQNPKK